MKSFFPLIQLYLWLDIGFIRANKGVNHIKFSVQLHRLRRTHCGTQCTLIILERRLIHVNKCIVVSMKG